MADEQASCDGCGRVVPAEDRFCGTCGRPRGTLASGSAGTRIQDAEHRETFASGFMAGLRGEKGADDSTLDQPNGTEWKGRPSAGEDHSQYHSDPTNHYPMWSFLLLMSIPGSLLVIQLISMTNLDHPVLGAIALLLVPFTVFCWIFTTIRAIHLAGLRFWFIPSTYVTLVGGIVALIISITMILFAHESARRGHDVRDTTLYIAAALLFGGCVVWSYFYNWRRTGSAVLAISLTVLQTLSAAFAIGVINLWLDRNNAKRRERECGTG